MRNTIVAGIPISGLAASSPLFAQATADESAELRQRVKRLEQQVQQLEQDMKPVRAQQAAHDRQAALRKKLNQRLAQDQKKHSPEQLRDAEQLYQVANQKWGSPEANESLQAMVKKYPDINRTGCAMLYLAKKSEGDERAKYLQDCIEKYNDCFYGDGVQVGAFARLLLAQDYKSKGDEEKAAAFYAELKAKYADAVDHRGGLLLDSIAAESK
jgi:hypothetical protein